MLSYLVDFSQAIAIIIGGLVVWIVYWLQERRKIINAATLVKLEIDAVEKKISNLSDMQGREVRGASPVLSVQFELLFQSVPIYQTLDWFTQRHLLIPKIGAGHVDKLNDFFFNVIRLEEARKMCKEVVFQNRFHKIQATQLSISELLSELAKAQSPPATPQEISAIIERFGTFFDGYARDFLPGGAVAYYETATNHYENISNTPAYEAVKKVAKMDKV